MQEAFPWIGIAWKQNLCKKFNAKKRHAPKIYLQLKKLISNKPPKTLVYLVSETFAKLILNQAIQAVGFSILWLY